MIAGIHISQERFVIDVLTALKSSLEHRRKHVLRLLQLYGDQDLYLHCLAHALQSNEMKTISRRF